jgi:hypothetical protein
LRDTGIAISISPGETKAPNTIAVILNPDAGLGNQQEDVRRAVEAMQDQGMHMRLIRPAPEKPWKVQIDTLLAEKVDTRSRSGRRRSPRRSPLRFAAVPVSLPLLTHFESVVYQNESIALIQCSAILYKRIRILLERL